MAAEPEIVLQATNAAPPEVLEFGRYKVFEDPSGWHIARAVGTCETCQACGCGEQADPIRIPSMLIAMARQGGGMAGIKAGLKGLVNRG